MTGYQRKILVYLWISCLAVFCNADTIDGIIRQQKQKKTTFAILVVAADSGQRLYQKNAAKAMIPASNMKVISTAASLHYLGPDYVFQTKVGLLKDSLVVIGAGDPLLGEPKLAPQDSRAMNTLFDEIISSLKNAEISAIEDVIIDVSIFDNNRVHPSWPPEQLNQWYACEVSGLNFCNNCVRITAERTQNGSRLKMEPANSYINLVNKLKRISKGSSAVGAYRNCVANKLLIKGKLNQLAGFDVAIEEPQGLFASILADRLKGAGISIRGRILQKYVKQDKTIQILKVFETPIRDVWARCNKDSLGLAAECLVKTISAKNTQGDINGEWPHGLALIARYLNSLEIGSEQFVMDDGSGLSRKNRLSPNALVTVLRDIYTCNNRDVFFDSLAVGGVDGTISKYFRQAPYKGNICGKTGYISGIRSFSGICKTSRGDILFSILTEGGNGYTRGCINKVAEAIYDGNY